VDIGRTTQKARQSDGTTMSGMRHSYSNCRSLVSGCQADLRPEPIKPVTIPDPTTNLTRRSRTNGGWRPDHSKQSPVGNDEARLHAIAAQLQARLGLAPAQKPLANSFSRKGAHRGVARLWITSIEIQEINR
jgi:hypothetical protein